MPLFQAFTSLFGGGSQKRMDKDTFSLPTTSGSTKYDLGLVRVSFLPRCVRSSWADRCPSASVTL